MSTKYKFRDIDQLYFVSFSVVYWIDLFIRQHYRDIILESWRYCQLEKGMDLYAWCIMTSHIHMIIGTHKEKMENIMRDMKRFTSIKLRHEIGLYPGESRKEWLLDLMKKAGQSNRHNKDFQLWQQDNHPIELTTPKITHQKLDYLHDNPVEAGIVDKPEEYLYSSARDYDGRRGLIDIKLLDPLLL